MEVLMEQPTLSLCMIAKNESEHIGRCLQSAKDWVDEIIVVDTGSTDDTREIARSWGATVIDAEWRDDFSFARNISLERATGDWILFLDCDEQLAPGSGPELRALIRGSRYEAYFIQVSNLTEINSTLLVPSVRLFRNRPVFRFEGRIHEQIATSILAHYGQQSIGQCTVSIIHHGYHGQEANIQAKIKRNLKLLKSTADAEKNGFYYYNLGIEHLRLGERENALGCFLESARMTAANLGYAPILALRTATTLIELKRYHDAARHLKYYQGLYGDFKDLVLLEAICYLHCGRYSQASVCLDRYFAMPPSPAWYPTEALYCGVPAEEFRDWLRERALPRYDPGISACIIGRNEAGRIRHCIHSVNEIAREVIYVDTGSTDETPAIAFQHGAKVLCLPWPGSFSEARNYALDQAASEWILVIDADEVLPDESKKQIAELLKEAPPEAGGYFFKVCTFLDNNRTPAGNAPAGNAPAGNAPAGNAPAGRPTARVPIRQMGGALRPPGPSANCHLIGSCRLFRKRGARYRGAAGESVVASLIEAGWKVAPVEIAIHHLHYQSEPEYVARKRQWKVETITRGLRDDPVRQNYLLGVESFYGQDFAAAADRFEACRHQSDMAGTPDFFSYYALSLINAGDYNRAARILEEGSGLFPDYTDLTYLLAITHCALEHPEAAETLLRRCLEMGDAAWQKYLASPGTGGFKAMHSLGTILAQRGLVSEAADLLFRAASSPEGFEQAVAGIVVLSDKMATPLEQLLEDNGLLNPASLSAASRTYARMLRWQDCLRYLALACDQVAREPAPRNFTGLIQTVDLLIKTFCRGN
jgi:glycosyltransferase involved in cell wall biosynthesis